MESEPGAPPEPAAAAAASGSIARGGTGAGAADAAPPAVSPVLATGITAHHDDHDDQATVLDLRREQHSNGAAPGPQAPLGGQIAAEQSAHDAATYQDASPGATPVWHIPSTPPYVPAPPRQPPPGAVPAPRSHAPWRTAQSWGPTTFTVSADTAAGFSYLLWWLSGLTVYFAERNNRYVRFHALQSILLTGVFTVLGVGAFVLDALLHDLTRATHWTVFGALGSGVAIVVVVLGIVLPWLGTMIGAWTGHHIRWPIVGAYAERYAAPPLHISGIPF